MAITGVANLAVKVRDLEGAVTFYRRAGADVTEPEAWRDGRARRRAPRSGADHAVHPRDLRGPVALPDEGFLHSRVVHDDSSTPSIEGHDVVWGPEVVSGPTFGTRRIAFVDAPGGIRLEFMEQLEDPQ